MTKKLLVLYSMAHFWVDLSCAFLMFRMLSAQPDWGLYLLLYNFCAFALQMPLGLLADRWNRNGLAAATGCLLVALAVLYPWATLTAVTAGVGNALFHLGGGIDVLNDSGTNAARLGVFVSPGALGLFLGSIGGREAGIPLWLPVAGLIVLAGGIAGLCRHTYGSFHSRNVPLDLTPHKNPAWLLPLTLVVILRSYMGMNQSFAWKGEGAWAGILTLALVLGKTAGGFLADRIGAKRASAISLLLAAVLYLASAFPMPGTLAVFLFNMTMPITLWAAAKVLPGAKGFAFGLLTFALFLGYLPSYLGWPSLLTGSWAYAFLAAVSLALLWRPLDGGKEAAICLRS